MGLGCRVSGSQQKVPRAHKVFSAFGSEIGQRSELRVFSTFSMFNGFVGLGRIESSSMGLCVRIRSCRLKVQGLGFRV